MDVIYLLLIPVALLVLPVVPIAILAGVREFHQYMKEKESEKNEHRRND